MGASAWDRPSVRSGREGEGVVRFERGERVGRRRMLRWVEILWLVALAGLGVTVYAVLAL